MCVDGSAHQSFAAKFPAVAFYLNGSNKMKYVSAVFAFVNFDSVSVSATNGHAGADSND